MPLNQIFKLLLLLFSSFLISSCSVLSSKDNYTNSTFISYSAVIELGKENVIDRNYHKALILFREGFKKIDKPLASHCFTALQLSATLNKKRDFVELLEIGFRVGLKPEFLKKDSILTQFIRDNKFIDTVTTKYKKNAIFYDAGINNFLKDTLSKISQYDNKWKVHYLDSLSNIDPKNKSIYEKKYDSIISNLVELKLTPLIRKWGYLGERQIGIEFVQSRANYPEDYAFVNNKIFFVLLHYYSYPRSCSFNGLFFKEVLKGNMIPEHYASIIDFQARFGKNKFCVVEYYNQWGSSEDSLKFEAINLRRKKIGLSSFQVLEKKYLRGKKTCKEYDKGNYKHIKLFYWCG